MKRSLLALGALLFVAGCSQQSSIQTSGDPSEVNQLSDIKTPHTFMLRGTVIIGHESQSIQPCHSDLQYWINLSPAQWQAGTDIQSSPYQPMYGELIGHFEAPPKGGFANDYPARFVVSQINTLVAGEGASCQRNVQPTKAFGTEPFWSVQVVNGELVFSEMGKPKQQQIITEQILEINKRVYQSRDFSLTMSKGICKDSMVESIYGWHSEVAINGKKYQGCATLAAKDTTLNWVEAYQGTSTIGGSGLTIGLTLNPDHSAVTTYDYNTDEPQLVETGIWQATKDNKLHVLMSRHQRQYMISERIFTKNGTQISTDKERVNGVIFPIQSGLTLYSIDNVNSTNTIQGQ
ncbi:lipoprotein [Aliivibrio sp. S3MY1]|uniref:COG3650 family protein n=1 Tax=unclassified Aliivibrio TaxID=2645654 RepID=UPI0023792E58|nr:MULTISPECIES: lipoprotein [unclassified Aliivibrio]MDD9195335.1 lipoprotein [Aliivibrio sp. S3MY1]MDD9198934.1 lipoprotein [Aliivibrio sp. S2MY1]